ncbi:MAG: hypothetical protein Kow0029_21410 [Candidatus Rifleibacteriota bacterium]
MLSNNKKALIMALVIIMTGASRLIACSEYTHLWQPAFENSSEQITPEGLAVFICNILKKLPATEDKWFVCCNPVSLMPESCVKSVASAVAILNESRVEFHSKLSPFEKAEKPFAAIWLDLIDPVHQAYLWRDENKPPLAMFRTGELDTAVIRVMARDSAGKIVLIDEFKHLFLLESDFMLPGWIGVGAAWQRRLSLQTGFSKKRYEWTFSVPPDQETINSTPYDIVRFYFGDVPSNNVDLSSNYR